MFETLVIMKIIFPLILSIIFFNACSKENQDLQNLPDSLKEIIAESQDCFCNPFIDKYEWRNKNVYLSSCNGPACNGYQLFYDEDGQQIKMDSASIHHFQDSAALIKVVWSCK